MDGQAVAQGRKKFRRKTDRAFCGEPHDFVQVASGLLAPPPSLLASYADFRAPRIYP